MIEGGAFAGNLQVPGAGEPEGQPAAGQNQAEQGQAAQPAEPQPPNRRPGRFSGLFNRIKEGVGHVAERVPRVEGLFNGMGRALHNTIVFGRNFPTFIVGVGGGIVAKSAVRELGKAGVAYAGLAGAVGGGVTGAAIAGGFVGAFSGALVEYARQVNRKLDTKLDTARAEPARAEELRGRKKAWLFKLKSLRDGGVLKPADTGKIITAAVIGGVAGAGAGAIVDNIPGIRDFMADLRSGVGGAIDKVPVIGGIKSTVGDALGVAGRTAGDLAGGAGGAIGDLAGEAGEKIGDAAGTVGGWTDQVLGVKGAKDFAGDKLGDLGGKIDEVRGVTKPYQEEQWGNLRPDYTEDQWGKLPVEDKVPGGPGEVLAKENLVPKADLDEANKTIASLQQQLEQAKAAGGAAGEAAKIGAQVVEQASSQAQTAFESFGGSISLAPDSNPWEVSQNILNQMGVVNPTPAQIMELDRIICQENGIGVPEWGIRGNVDARQLPVGFKINLTDEVKKSALALARR